MTTARFHSSPARQWPIPASLARHVLLPPNSEQIEAQPEPGEQGSSAIVLHKEMRHVLIALEQSKLHHVDCVNADSLSSLSIDEVASDLARLTHSVIAGLPFGSCLMTALGTIVKSGDNGKGLGHRLHSGNQCLGLRAHRKTSLVDRLNIRNIVPNCKRVFA